jgi:hypothetical protein
LLAIAYLHAFIAANAVLVQRLPHLGSQGLARKRFLKEMNAFKALPFISGMTTSVISRRIGPRFPGQIDVHI